MITRRVDWVSSIQPENRAKLLELENKLSAFYETNPNYYSEIDFTSSNWINPSETGYQFVAKTALESSTICEVGCGSANILKHHSKLETNYSGCDFSPLLMRKNKELYPAANFKAIDKPNVLPFADASFDLVFSIFVIEHSTNPAKLLDECSRILKPGGKLLILCPDFLGSGWITSQRSGWSDGTTSQKLKKGRIVDALVTLFDNRVRIPFRCKTLSKDASTSPLFLVNLNPVVFEDPFLPDVDAVYLTFKPEIIQYLKHRFLHHQNSEEICAYEKRQHLIFLSFTKVA